MLGRLFKQNTTGNTQNSHHSHHHHHHSHHPQLGNTANPLNPQIPDSTLLSPSANYEDSYSREILYGTHNANQLKPYQFNNKLFRIIISQDGGNLRSKQVLYDSAVEPQSPTASTPTQPTTMSSSCSNATLVSTTKSKPLNTRNITTSKVHHNVSDLNDYMFGCGLPSNETHCNTKIHVLPQINNSASAPYNAVLITRLFSISDLEVSEWSPLSSLSSQNNNWIPTPALPIKESNIKKYPFKNGKDNSTSKTNNFINSRFSIGLVVPLESVNSITDVIFNNWHEISHYLIILQKLVYRKLMIHLNSGFNYDNESNITGCQFLVNKRIQFPNYILHGDFDINSQLYKLIKSIHYNFNIPKLINSNYLMKTSVLNESHQYNPMLINWVLEILNWLEFKEGKPTTPNYNYNSSFLHSNSLLEYGLQSSTQNVNTNTFLASLLALLIPYRKSLSIKPYYNVARNVREVTRVVVMTENPVVAKKLVFILNGMIPNNQRIEEVPRCTQMYDSTFEEEEVKSDKDQTFSVSTSPEKSLSPIMTSTTHGILPIPIKQTSTSGINNVFSGSGDSSSDNSLSVKWEIPNKSTASIPTTNTSRVETTAVGIPIVTTSSTNSTIAHPHSVHSKSSISYLSSSLNSSYSSSQSLYSLSKLGGSFMDKWKNSFGSANSHSNPLTPTHAPSNAQGYFETGDQQYGSLSKRNSIQSLRTPSPALEIDEFNWNQHSKPININTGVLSSNLTHVIGSHKLSRTQSMYDLYNMNNLMNVMSEETDSLDSLSESNQESTATLPPTTAPMSPTPVTSTPAPATNTLEIKRSKTSVFTPLINDNLIKNVDEHNKSTIRSKCRSIMLMSKYRVKKATDDEGTLEIDNINYDNNENDEDVVFKHKALLSSVAFSDEFRPEFSVQSCPINPKLEQQVMNAMKNDLLFYQNNCNYDAITTRTIFISLRAREIKLIEMNLQNPPSTTLSSGGDSAMTGSSPVASYISEQSNKANASRRNSSTSNSYRTRIKKVYTPTKNLGNRELINKIEQVLDEMNQLFTIQLQLFQDKKNKSSGIDFHNRLSKLVLSLLE
ncbi:uncharacterized protein SPAPADRAFT_55372 [Spathaspora passalidarum NRRL Y-27907]|uniref:LST4 longin domain-containing protein n=1 Tax=Spathaspora passalidarum (strain NRRL Y-27907 / 11-Y1) TaxID=619300 RepID=G3AMR0_SPAPN|nr:uncharacterized protein SPAPADRAFT_55372 [Spathaspora passalidarum NRRL Y-27907]EGW33504.1 hypothetical protein SPAPADRAFT_55372 [Spathaspora passalidarum NRRL Y-27907]